ncbi:reverse transcriptase domain-containing protein [Tanacetum coccineum]
MTPPPGFSTPPQIPNNTTSERPPVTTAVFTTTTPENTLFAYHASTSTNPKPTISHAFVEANYEILESLLRERRRQIRNEDLQTKLEYFIEDYDEEREMEPRPEPRRKATPVLRLRSSRLCRQRERVVGFEDAPNREGNRRKRNAEGIRPLKIGARESENRRANLPPLLAAHLRRNKNIAKNFEQPSRLPGANWSKDKTRYFHFHEDYGHETNQCRELRHQIEEAVKSGQLAHLVKGVKKEKATGEITFPPLLNVSSADPVIIKAYISGRQVNIVYLDGGSSCEVIYEHCFLKLKPSIRSLRVDSNTFLVGFSEEQSWPLGEIPLEITIGEGPIAVTKTLTFVIVKSDSPHNLLLGRTAMQQMGIVVSAVHGAIKFHTPRGIGTIFSEYNSQKPKEEEGCSTNKYQGNEIVLSCIDTEQRAVINDKYPEQKITIGRQLPTRIKIRLCDLLKKYIDVFAWTLTHITGIARVLMIGGKTFNTEHRINVFNHAEPIKQKKRNLARERNEVIHGQVEELTEAGIL